MARQVINLNKFHISDTQFRSDTYLNKIIIEVNNEEPWDELVVRHEPKLPSCSVKEVIQASKIGHLNIEKLLMDTIQVNNQKKSARIKYCLSVEHAQSWKN